MKTKIIAILLVGMFLLIGISTLSATVARTSIVKKETHTCISSKETDNINIILEDNIGNPDLIAEFRYWFKEGWVLGETEITNIGDAIAIKPEDSPLINWHTEYWYGEVKDYNLGIIYREILPGESHIIPGWIAIGLEGIGSKHTITVDPQNVIDEGVEGEKNNIVVKIVIKNRAPIYDKLICLFPNVEQLLQRILKI